jgi:hypothetical protein
MLDWFSTLRDSHPLASATQARKFAARLDRDLFAAAEAISRELRQFRQDTQRRNTRNFAALLALDEEVRPIRSRIEQDYLAAAHSRHSLRDRLWEAGYDLAQRFAEAYQTHFGEGARLRTQRDPGTYAQVAVRLISHRTAAYRFRLYRHEEWVPSSWREINAAFRAICDLGLDAVVLPQAKGRVTNATVTFCVLQLMRLANAGSYTPHQTFALWQKLTEFSDDLRLTPRPSSEGGFVIDIAGEEGLQPRQYLGQGGQYLFLDTTNIFQRACAWLDELDRAAAARSSPLTADPRSPAALLGLRSAVLRFDPDFKPLTRASQRSEESGRLLAALGVRASCSALSHDPRVIAAALDGTEADLTGTELHTLGYIRTSALKRLRKDLPPDLARLDMRFWHLRDKSDTGYRAVVAHAGETRFRLRDLALLSEDPPHVGWQIAIIVRLLKLPAGHVELGLQVISRDAETIDLAGIRTTSGIYGGDDTTISLGSTFRALRLRAAFYAKPVMGTTWIMPMSEYSAGSQYSAIASRRRFEIHQILAEGADWIWVKPTELS